MKKVLVVLALSVLSLSVASASLIPCTVADTGAGGSVNSSTVITCGVLTFDDFSIPSATATAGASNPGVIDVIPSATWYDSVNGDVQLTFDPALSASSAADFADDEFEFAVSGGISEVDLAVGGSGASINEKVCSSAFSIPGVCTGTLYASLTVLSGTSPQPVCAPNAGPASGTPPECPSDSASTNPVYIYKNILVNGPNGTLSEFSQSFNPTTIPEPVSMVLLGSGLLGLGLLRRRARKS